MSTRLSVQIDNKPVSNNNFLSIETDKVYSEDPESKYQDILAKLHAIPINTNPSQTIETEMMDIPQTDVSAPEQIEITHEPMETKEHTTLFDFLMDFEDNNTEQSIFATPENSPPQSPRIIPRLYPWDTQTPIIKSMSSQSLGFEFNDSLDNDPLLPSGEPQDNLIAHVAATKPEVKTATETLSQILANWQ